MTRRPVGACCAAAVILLLAVGCAKAGRAGPPETGRATVAAVGASASQKASAPASPASQPKPVWFQSLQMTSVTSGWALVGEPWSRRR
jgi:hypothetical protein